MVCSLHMLCAIFSRIILILENCAREDNIVSVCNSWFLENHLKIIFDDEQKIQIKVNF